MGLETPVVITVKYEHYSYDLLLYGLFNG